jgi:PPOX class probable F420-dependent enzyme
MNEEEAATILADTVAALRRQPYDALVDRSLHESDSHSVVAESGAEIQVEIQAFWDGRTPGNLRVIAAIDGGRWRAFRPLSTDFIVAPVARSSVSERVMPTRYAAAMFSDQPHAFERLDNEPVIWLTTVSPGGQPQASPVWFLREGNEILIYSRPRTAKVRNIESNPRVALNLDGNGRGGDIVTIEGSARIAPGELPPVEVPAFVAKYDSYIARLGWTAESFGEDYSLPIRIEMERGRAW